MKIKTRKILALIIALSVLGIICTLKYMAYNKIKKLNLSPICQLDTNWMYKDIVFCIDSELKCLGELKLGSDIIYIKARFGKGFDTMVILESYNDNYTILSGYCNFKENSFIMDVDISSVDYIKVGDKITFKKVKELPDWATELVETSDES